MAPGSEVRLSRDYDPGSMGGVTRPQAAALLADGVELLADYQDRLAAQDTFGVLMVLRFLKRIDRPEKNWKFSPSDVRERRYWEDYQRAFESMLSPTSTRWAPWCVVPADHKWYSRLATAAVLVTALDAINPRYPAADPSVASQMTQVRDELAAELGRTGPGSSPAD